VKSNIRLILSLTLSYFLQFYKNKKERVEHE
jgi:hypothetical protein